MRIDGQLGFLVGLLLSLPCLSPLFGQGLTWAEKAREQAVQRASPDRQASVAVAQRVGSGDKQALSELAGLDPVVAIPILAHYAKDRSTDAERADIARDTLKKVHGVRDYFRRRIKAFHNENGGDADTAPEFRTLTLIGNKDAVAVAAPFLFDDSGPKEPAPGTDFSVGAPLKYQAVFALMDMKLSDAPTNKPFYAANEEDIKKWREWWLAHKAEYEK